MNPCVFVKYKYEIKFEDFYTNHPAIYLPFIIYNWLIIALLPNVYKNENSYIEQSRIEILQNSDILLNLLQIIINCVLDINIELNLSFFKNSIRILNEKENLSRDDVLPYLSIENYMSNKDAELFMDNLSIFFPESSIMKSIDAVPCSEFYDFIADKLVGVEIWGPPFWTIIHYTTYFIDKLAESQKKEDYQQLLCSLTGFIDLLLPCSICRYHYLSLYKLNEDEYFNRPFQLTLPFLSLEYAKKNRLFEFYSKLHKHCKPNNNREELSTDYYKNIYDKFLTRTLEIKNKL